MIRLVSAFTPLSPAEITDPVLITATQLTAELDESLFPMNKKSTQKEPQTWFGALGRQGIPPSLLNTLRRYLKDENTGTMRAKKAAACLFWISPTPMAEIERALTQHGGAFDGAAGPVRSVSARTCDLLPAVARVATFLHPGLDLTERLPRLLVRLELGVPAPIVALARHAGTLLGRPDYLELVKAGLHTPEAIEAAAEDQILGCLAGDAEKAKAVRDAVAALRAEPEAAPAPALPEYEA